MANLKHIISLLHVSIQIKETGLICGPGGKLVYENWNKGGIFSIYAEKMLSQECNCNLKGSVDVATRAQTNLIEPRKFKAQIRFKALTAKQFWLESDLESKYIYLLYSLHTLLAILY